MGEISVLETQHGSQLYTIGIQTYMTEVGVYLIEKRTLRVAWNIRGLVNSLIRKFDIIFDNNYGFKTPPPRVSDNMKTQETPP
ncbi:hypothetical protein Glove_402g44 [Diversispora epigaea]|uniref:Uncharacterized protein n=1 Tax=Diversispora epigaea TaxID=1348612 RepID=A0A397H7E3_9GLOM|nr:hypothetical protein Glove_402g44 [Diversispora epigaea]